MDRASPPFLCLSQPKKTEKKHHRAFSVRKLNISEKMVHEENGKGSGFWFVRGTCDDMLVDDFHLVMCSPFGREDWIEPM